MYDKLLLSHSIVNSRNQKIIQRHFQMLLFNQIFCWVGYVSSPPQPINEHAKQYQFNVGLRKGFIRHLFAGNGRDVEKVSQRNVALSHFHEKVLLLNAQHLHGKQFIKNIDAELGQAVKKLLLTAQKLIMSFRISHYEWQKYLSTAKRWLDSNWV